MTDDRPGSDLKAVKSLLPGGETEPVRFGRHPQQAGPTGGLVRLLSHTEVPFLSVNGVAQQRR